MFQDYVTRAQEVVAQAGTPLRILAILVLVFVGYRAVRFFTTQFQRLSVIETDPLARAQREQRLSTLGHILDNLARVILIGLALVMVLSEVGINVDPLVAGAGIAGIALGFGAQSLVKDFFSGFFIIFENQFAIGDEVTVAGHSGTVERMTLRTTTLRDTTGNLHIVPNGKIETVTVVAREWARINVDVTIPYGEDIDRALDVVDRAARDYMSEHPDAFLDESPGVGVNDLGPRGATVRLSVRTAKGRNLAAGRDLRRAVMLALYGARVRLVQPKEE